MRSRNIKPGFFKNEYLSECAFETRILYAGLWCLADREGRMEYRPKRIKAEVFPFDNVDVDSMVKQLCKHGFVRLYEFNGCAYLDIPAFSRNQNPHVKEKESDLPAYESSLNLTSDHAFQAENSDSGTRNMQAQFEHSASTSPILLIPDSLIPDSHNPLNAVSGSRKRKRTETTESFEAFWKLYPVKKDKPDAVKEWSKLDEPTHDEIMQSLTSQLEHANRQKALGNFVPNMPYPSRYLRREGWKDEPVVYENTKPNQNAAQVAQPPRKD